MKHDLRLMRSAPVLGLITVDRLGHEQAGLANDWGHPVLLFRLGAGRGDRLTPRRPLDDVIRNVDRDGDRT